MTNRIISILTVMLTISHGGYAQTDSIVSKVHTIDEVEVRSRQVNDNVLAVTPTQVMRQEQLTSLGIVSLADAVKKFAGTSVRDYGGIGGLKTVSVRNLGAHHTLVSYDGIAVGNAQAGQVDISRYTTENLSQLSLSIGQVDDIMQSARHYASAGVLSIQTLRPTLDQRSYSVHASLRGGSFGWVNPSVSYWQKLGSETSLASHLSYMRADGVYPFTLKNGYLKTREKRYNSDVESVQGEVNLYHTFRDQSELQAKAAYYQSEQGLPGVVILYNTDAKERLWNKNFFAQAEYKRRFAERWELRTRLKYNYAWDRYEDVNLKYEGGKQTDINRQQEYYASATLGWKLTSPWTLALAEDIVVNKLHNNFEMGMQPVRFTSLTALSFRFSGERLMANGYVLGTVTKEHVKKGNAPDDRSRLSPTLSLSYRLLNDESLFVRLMAKSTFRLPSFNDLYYQRLGNNQLRPEKAMEYNVGLTWEHPFSSSFRIYVTTDAYYNHVKDKIVAFPSTYVWKMVNYGKVDIKGLGFTIGSDLPILPKVNAQILASYTLQEALDKSGNNEQIPYTPKHSGNVSVILKTPWANVGYSVMGCGERYSNNIHTDEYRLRAYWEHTLTLSREIKLRHCNFMLTASIVNLTDEQYEVVRYYPMPGRNWIVGVVVKL